MAMLTTPARSPRTPPEGAEDEGYGERERPAEEADDRDGAARGGPRQEAGDPGDREDDDQPERGGARGA